MKRLLPIVFIALSCSVQAGAQTIRHIAISGNVRTQRQTIERELLFAVGAGLDSALLAETERNLRRLPFLGKVAIEVIASAEYADIEVRVQDLYARALSPLVSGSLDALNYGLIAVDYNFSGRGQQARIAFEDRADRGPRGQISLSDPRLGGTMHRAHIDLALQRQGHDLRWSFSRPYTSLETPRTYGISQWVNRTPNAYYQSGSPIARYATKDRGIDFWYGLSRGSHYKIRSLFQVRYADYVSPTALLPQPHLLRQRHLQTGVTLVLWQPLFRRAQFIANLGPVEDLQMGTWLSVRAGYAHAMGSADPSYAFYGVQFSPRWTYRQTAYVFATGLARWRHTHRGLQKAYLLGDLRAYLRFGTTHSAAVRLRWDALHRSSPIDQLLLGLDSGLRAFGANAFSGKKRATCTAELRPTFLRTPWYVLAGAVFLDVATAWDRASDPLRARFSAGLGLRAGLPKLYGTPVWRLDLAHAIDQPSWRLSIGIGQYF